MTKRIGERPTPPMFFEQVPVEVVKKIVIEKSSTNHKPGNGKVTREPAARKTEPYSISAERLSVV